jgi:CheY-like chemotaxis protein
VANSRPQPAAGVEKKLGELTPARRQALLLTAMEGFNVSDTARILGVGEEEVKQMVAQAVREISDQPSTKVLIIEDEPIISLDLQSIVREMGHTGRRDRDHARRSGARRSQDRARTRARGHQAREDGSSGIDAVRQILSEVQVPIVFITAYPERLLTRRAAGADVPGDQAVRAGNGARGGEPGVVVYLEKLSVTEMKRGPSGARLHSGLSVQPEAAQTGGRPRNAPATSATSVSTRKMKNRIFAIPGCSTRNRGEAEHCGDDRNNEKRQSPRQHKKPPNLIAVLSTGSPAASALLPRLEPETRDHSSGSPRSLQEVCAAHAGSRCGVHVLRTIEEAFEQRGGFLRAARGGSCGPAPRIVSIVRFANRLRR